MSASLYIVATPIGHLDDMSLRAIDVLRSVNLIAAEDTRHSSKLLRHFDIRTPLISYHDHSETSDLEGMLKRLRAGETIALISDAGTPLVSDPGYKLVVACHREQITVVPIPGPSAVTSALSAACLPSDRFYFEGFLPAKSGQRAQRLKTLRFIESTLIFFESPRRLSATLDAISSELGDREAAVCRELTKRHETIRRDRLSALSKFVEMDSNQTLGSASVVCTDKTGTLTKGKMTMVKIFRGNKLYAVSGKGFDSTQDGVYVNDHDEEEMTEEEVRTFLVDEPRSASGSRSIRGATAGWRASRARRAPLRVT